MTASDRFHLFGPAAHRAEEEGLELIRSALPDHSPYSAWSLFTIQLEDGRRYEIDSLVLTPHALFVVELKSWRGRVVDGDVGTLTTESPARGREVVDHPLPLLTKKMHALTNRLRRVARSLLGPGNPIERLRVEELVVLSHATGIDERRLPAAAAARAHLVIGQDQLSAALRQASFPGARADLRDNAYAREMQKALTRVLQTPEFGLRPQARQLTLMGGTVRLNGIIEETSATQDRWTIEPNESMPRRRVRFYLVKKDEVDTARRIERRAAREAALLKKLGEHPDILALDGYDPDGPFGPALIFRGFEGTALDRFLQQSRDAQGQLTLSLDDRLAIVQRVAHALTFCHRNDIVHGALSPDAVLVRRLADKRRSHDGSSTLEVKLTRFALATDDETATSVESRLLTRMAGATASVFEAPEVARGTRPDVGSDLFSLGALAYYLFSGELPARTAAELSQRLHRDDGLVLSAVRSDVDKALNDVVFDATRLHPSVRLQKFPTPKDFVDQLEDALTGPESHPEVPNPTGDPRVAEKGTWLNDLKVLGVLGKGATAIALKVQRDDAIYALKVPLDDSHSERLAREGEVLRKLGQNAGLANITRLIAEFEISGWPCLLIEFAGDRTLAEELREQGTISIEFARRWGEELLLALRSLEEVGVQHRDIKPANIGLTVGAQKQKKRLLLFDFYLASVDATAVDVGTPAYKDPGLLLRGRWDDAADRWAAAVTLYEMFTGTRPQPVSTATGPDELAVRIEGDRIDADVRDGLVRFFKKAFLLGADRRYSTADDMREAFLQALRPADARPFVAEEDVDDVVDEAVPDKIVYGLVPTDSVLRLPLSTRARNALDRMGIYTVQDLAQLRPNWLNGVRGVGTKTARSLVELAARVQRVLDLGSADVVEAFMPGWHGAIVPIEKVRTRKLRAATADAFIEAGFVDSARLAAAPASLVKNLVRNARGTTLAEVRAWLESLVTEDVAPTTLRQAVYSFAPAPAGRQKPSLERLRHYLGVTPLDGVVPGNANALAEHLDVTRQLISLELQRFRTRWKEGGITRRLLEDLYVALRQALDASAGVLPMQAAGDVVLGVVAPEPDVGAPEARRLAEALVRIVGEVDVGELGIDVGVRLLIKTRSRTTVVALDRPALAVADALGEVADDLVSTGEVHVEAAAAVALRGALTAATDLDDERLAQATALSDRHLVELAVASAASARLSARGELYPAGLASEKAVMLSAPALQGSLTVDEVRRRIRARYPEALELPDRPDLDELLKPLRLGYSEAKAAFVPLEPTRTPQLATELFVPKSNQTATPLASRERASGDEPGRAAARTFDEQVQHATQEGGFRVLLWRGLAHAWGRSAVDRAPDGVPVAKALARSIGGVHHAMDRLLLAAAGEVAADNDIPGGIAPALEADALGPSSPDWENLIELMRLAGERVVQRLLDGQTPLVLTQFGLLARYGMLDLLERLAQRHRESAQKPPTFVVLPVFVGEGAVVEVGVDVAPWLGVDPGTRLVPVRGLLRHEVIEVPSAWVERHPLPSTTTDLTFQLVVS
jgi:serine/threonine protein kinase